MDAEIKFFFYLGAVVCFALATLGEGWRFGGRTRRGQTASIALLPLGLALAFFLTMWDTGVAAF